MSDTTRSRPAAHRLRTAVTGLLLLVGGLVASAAIVIFCVQPEYAYSPGPENAVNEPPTDRHPAFDLWGKSISRVEADSMPTGERERLVPANGAVVIDDDLLRLGRESFYD